MSKDVIHAYCPCCESVQRMSSYVSITGEEITASDGSPAYVCENCSCEVYVSNSPED